MPAIAHPGLRFRDHSVAVPLDHRRPDGATIGVFAREVVASGSDGDELPWLLFLQGGPGGKSPRPARAEGRLAEAVKTHRVLLLDQRGTGRSAPVTARAVRGMSAARCTPARTRGVAAKNAEFHRAFPGDAAALRRVADHLSEVDVRLPDGDRLTVDRLRLLGILLGMSYGYAQAHWLLDEAWHGAELSDTFRYEVMALTGCVDRPLSALQEFIYGQAPRRRGGRPRGRSRGARSSRGTPTRCC